MSENLKIDPYGFREYDARWLYEKDINSAGIENLGKGLGTQIKNHTKKISLIFLTTNKCFLVFNTTYLCDHFIESTGLCFLLLIEDFLTL